MYPQVGIIILNWNGKEDTIECLESLKDITYPNYKILLVDNGSTDGSIECFKIRYPEIEIIENRENLGFAEGNNVGIRRAIDEGADYVLPLNNDTIVDSHFIEKLIEIAENDPKIGILGPKIYYYDNPRRINSAGGTINWSTGVGKNIGIGEIDTGQFNDCLDVEYLMGAAILIKSELIRKIGGFDNEFFLLLEDTELCVRAQKAGYRTVFCPSSKIYHKEGISGEKSPNPLYYMYRNRILFLKKHFPYGFIKLNTVLIYISMRTVLGIMICLKQGKFASSQAILKGYIDGLLGNTGKCTKIW